MEASNQERERMRFIKRLGGWELHVWESGQYFLGEMMESFVLRTSSQIQPHWQQILLHGVYFESRPYLGTIER